MIELIASITCLFTMHEAKPQNDRAINRTINQHKKLTILAPTSTHFSSLRTTT